MKKSEKNLGVIQNFILHITHCDEFEGELDFKRNISFTPELLYQMAKDYIEEDHVDGKDNPEDHIVTYSAESSFVFEDKDKKFPEHIIVVADFGNDIGTETVGRLSNKDNLQSVNNLLSLIKKNQ